MEVAFAIKPEKKPCNFLSLFSPPKKLTLYIVGGKEFLINHHMDHCVAPPATHGILRAKVPSTKKRNHFFFLPKQPSFFLVVRNAIHDGIS